MEEFLKAVVDKWKEDANAAARGLCDTDYDDLYFGLAPRDAVRPYVAYILRDTIGLRTNTTYYDQPDVQFNVFVGEDQLQTGIQIRDRLILTYDKSSYTLQEDVSGNTKRVVTFQQDLAGVPIDDPDDGYMIPIIFKTVVG